MKNFIKNILFFIAPIIILSYPLDLVISNVLKSKAQLCVGEYGVWNDILESKIDAEIAIYGSSRAWVHFNPVIFEKELHQKTYNFGIDGHHFHLQYLRHKEYFKYNTHPKIIIFSVDIFTLAKKKDLYNLNQFLPYMLWNDDFYEYTCSYNGFNSSDYYVPLKRYFGNINLSDICASTTKRRCNGFAGIDKKWNTDLKKAKASKPSYRIILDSTSILLFKQFINEMKKEDVRLIFVYTPEYIEGQAFVKNRNDIISVFDEISKKYNIPFFNYSCSDISYNKSLFYNTQHLNKKGADIFTVRFINDFKKYKSKTTTNIKPLADSAKNAVIK
jgi:hypothetical protein